MLDIIRNHPVGIEFGADRSDGSFYHADPVSWYVVNSALVEEWGYALFEEVIKIPAFDLVLIFGVIIFFSCADSPTVISEVTLIPPAIQYAQAKRAVCCGFHA